jgi:hypothetical protein
MHKKIQIRKWIYVGKLAYRVLHLRLDSAKPHFFNINMINH